ncbi:hypothetical protein ACH5BF_13930 [Arcobacter sp. YIC-464]|uniref:hypothetical protein n=1 Tax=Arcobacter sp. YIC-464 TaxID=3376631 RepID=UPI003C142BAF
MRSKLIVLVAFILAALSYQTVTKKTDFQISFYHWKNSFNEKSVKEKLYIKVLDISYSSKLEFVKTRFTQEVPKDFIPTIYITNEAMKNINFKKISSLILEQTKAYEFSELQIDCDWSLLSKANYFDLLKELKVKSNKKISATIRLHQIKYFSKTGVPPVDYGVLMYYNMANITDINTKNSILDNNIAKKYHYNFDEYPLRLKLALPLYSQAVRFRKDKPLDIFEGLKEEDFDKHFIKIDTNLYEVKKSIYFKKKYIYKGDIFRLEDSSKEDIATAINDFFSLSKKPFNEIIFYRYSYKNKYNLNNLIKDNL